MKPGSGIRFLENLPFQLNLVALNHHLQRFSLLRIDLQSLRQGEIRDLGGTHGSECDAEGSAVTVPDGGGLRQLDGDVVGDGPAAPLIKGSAQTAVIEHGSGGKVGGVQGPEAVEGLGAQRGQTLAQSPLPYIQPGLRWYRLAIGDGGAIRISEIGQFQTGVGARTRSSVEAAWR